MKHHLNSKGWAGIALLILAAPATLSGLDLDPVLIGEWATHPSGAARAVEVRGDYAYVASSWRFWVFDVTDRTDPQLKGHCALPALVSSDQGAVAVAGNYAYVPTEGSAQDQDPGLQIIDITDPTQPFLAGRYGSSIARGVEVVGHHAYTCVGVDFRDWSLHILDISNPTAPVLVGALDIPEVWIHGLAVAGHHAFLITGSSLEIIDVAEPSQPRRVGSMSFDARDVAVSGHYAYVVGQDGLRVIDVSNPANPVGVGSFVTRRLAGSVAVVGTLVCLGLPSGGLHMIDVSHPAQPRELAHCERHGWVTDVTLQGNQLYVTDGQDGLQIVDVGNPAQPIAVGGYPLNWSAEDVVLSGDYAYVAAGGSGLWVIDVSRPDQPRRVGHIDTTGHANSVFLQGQHAYLAQSFRSYGTEATEDPLVIIDISEPTNARQVGSVPTRGAGRVVEVAGDYAYLADASEGLQIIDIADPARPEIAASVPVGGRVTGLAVAGEFIYVADSERRELVTLRLTSPTQPEWMSTVALAIDHVNWRVNVTVQAGFAYLTRDGSYLAVFDLSNPASPTLVSSYSTGGWGSGAIAVGQHVFVSGAVVDVTDPFNPKRVSTLRGNGFAAAGDYVYAADGDRGLRIYHLGRPANPQRLGWLEFPDVEMDRPITFALAGDYAYVSTYHGWGGSALGILHVIDRSNPAALSKLHTFETIPGVHTPAPMLIVDQHLYVTFPYVTGLRVYDLQDPTSPLLVGHCPLATGAFLMRAADHHAYLLMDGGRLDIIDIGDPTSPNPVGTWIDDDIQWHGSGLAVEGDRLYLSGRTALKVFDINKPRQLRLLGQYNYDRQTSKSRVAIAGDHVYIGTDRNLDVIDVSDSRNPRWIGRTPLPEGDYEPCLTVSGHYAYLASWPGNLYVFDIRDPSKPVLVGSNYSPTRAFTLALDRGTLYAAGAISSPALIVFDRYRPPLRLDPPESLGAEGWRLRLWGAPGETLRLQRSSDLQTWEDWRTTVGTDLPQEFIDDTASQRARQFYRAVSP